MPASKRSPSGDEKARPTRIWHRTVIFRIWLLSTIAVFSLLTFLVATLPSFPLDLQITRALQSIHAPWFQILMHLISWPGYLPQWALIVLLIAWTLYVYGMRWEAATSLIAALSSGVINQLIKILIQRPRPSGDLVEVLTMLESYSFPSAHVMFYVACFGFAWYLAYTLLKQSWIRRLLLTIFGSLILLVGISRISLGVHWASDVLGAYLLGSLILAGILWLYQSRQHPPPA
jgi:membrane-associated phospholipid phosphatase